MTSNLHAILRINCQSRQFAEVKQSEDTDIICSYTVTPGHLLQSQNTDGTPSSFKFTMCNLVHPDKIIGTQ